MPKKHTPSYTTAKPSYVHPSLQSSRSPASSLAPSEPATVSQRIQQLRREQAPRATPEQRDELTSAVSSRTVPPDLRRILAIPEVNAPKPKANARTRRVVGAARPPPGPAAPTSWLQTSRHAPAYMRSKKKAGAEHGAVRFGTLARVTNEEFKRLPLPRSLVHQCLRTLALHWEELSEFEQHYLPSLPASLKEAILSYLTLYGERGGLSFKSLKILFQNEESAANAGWDETQFLDLTGLLNEHLTISDIGKCVKRSTAIGTLDLGALRITDATPSKAKQPVAKEIADSWEDEVEWNTGAAADDRAANVSVVMEAASDFSDAMQIPAARLQTPYFSNLSRLSLASPDRASWADLLRISSNLGKLTHLSLAYWPRPSMTPNAHTATMVSNHTRVALGGSHFYSDLDDDWHEATNILRRFSKDTYSLQWLDLEGCTWLKALTGQSGRSTSVRFPSTGDQDLEAWDAQAAIPGPDWNDAWRRVTYLNFFQGWIPSDNQSLQNMPAGIVPVLLLRWLRENKEREDVRWKLNPETGHAVAEWVNREKVARHVSSEIQAVRKRAGGAWCKADFGWSAS
ncbi:hypothetical protein EJ02DRAFT_431645 [Clathrospora elynae]|uniref:Tafazzin n=1 Tax=Clathrospora elynae TaxID=706981 RepID=A0A6A5SXX6_9PLEO|nr:hypothetical protein EJ02DRAFT_431645 [Clathrospora elynae]